MVHHTIATNTDIVWPFLYSWSEGTWGFVEFSLMICLWVFFCLLSYFSLVVSDLVLCCPGLSLFCRTVWATGYSEFSLCCLQQHMRNERALHQVYMYPYLFLDSLSVFFRLQPHVVLKLSANASSHFWDAWPRNLTNLNSNFIEICLL